VLLTLIKVVVAVKRQRWGVTAVRRCASTDLREEGVKNRIGAGPSATAAAVVVRRSAAQFLRWGTHFVNI